MKNKGLSLIALIITIAVLIIIATAVLQNGMQRTDDAKLAKHNADISAMQEEIENYYHFKGGELPVVNLTPYPIAAGSSLKAEIIRNNEQSDNFYILDLLKLGKVAGNDGRYIVSGVRHTVYYAEGTTVKGIAYHGLVSKNNVKLVSSHSYNNPKIPNGFSYVSGTWDEGYTIEDGVGNQFVWVPIGDFTLGGKNISLRFERTAFMGEVFNASYFYETNATTLQEITGSVNTYGGFYIAKYEASNNGGKVESKADKDPWTDITWDAAKTAAEDMDAGWDTSVESVLCYGTYWDTALNWLIQSGAKTLAEVKDDSTNWGNSSNAEFTYGAGSIKAAGSKVKINTGVSITPADRHMTKGIYDLAGNVLEWTMESYTSSYRVCRGGCYAGLGNGCPATLRSNRDPVSSGPDIGFRVALYIK